MFNLFVHYNLFNIHQRLIYVSMSLQSNNDIGKILQVYNDNDILQGYNNSRSLMDFNYNKYYDFLCLHLY